MYYKNNTLMKNRQPHETKKGRTIRTADVCTALELTVVTKVKWRSVLWITNLDLTTSVH